MQGLWGRGVTHRLSCSSGKNVEHVEKVCISLVITQHYMEQQHTDVGWFKSMATGLRKRQKKQSLEGKGFYVKLKFKSEHHS